MSNGYAELMKAYPNVKAESAPFLCTDLTFSHLLLAVGFKVRAKGEAHDFD